ncbi:reverse transcriptase, partial [Trifolium medium]|nr:reverse transcriptase [Trifolium medium]
MLLVEEGLLSLIASPRGTYIPFHALYVDDVMIFCRGNLSNFKALKNLFRLYGEISGQLINQ